MTLVMKPTTLHIVTVILWPQRVQCCILKKEPAGFTAHTAQTYDFPTVVTFAQPTILENTVRSFLHSQQVPHAFVSVALSQELIEGQPALEQHVLQCQLLAINTPFHCAGITSQEKAYDHAQQQRLIAPSMTSGLSAPDILCHMGLYAMAIIN